MALAPLLWLAFAGLLVLRARVQFGRWPRPYDPDPSDVGRLHHLAVQFGIPLMWALSLAGAIALVWSFRQLRSERARPLLALMVLTGSLVGVALLARLDPGYLFTWLGD